ncbi:MAG: PorP/SprF family type IX secretion system membrane protein [Bacteroidota bacterium]
MNPTLKGILLLFAFYSITVDTFAQLPIQYSNYYIDPYLVNPAFVGRSGFTTATANYRQQWEGINDAPNTASLFLQHPLNDRISLGVNVSRDERGALSTIKALGTFGYRLYFGSKASTSNMLSFGISAGVDRTTVDMDNVPNPDDPAISALQENTSSLDGQFGMAYTFKNLELSFALPTLFQTEVASINSFNEVRFGETKTTFSSVSYNININQNFTLQPWITYRTFSEADNQYEVLGIVNYKNIAWLGGSYNQTSGVGIFIGFSIGGRFKASYNYQVADRQTPELGQGSHEFQIYGKLSGKDHLAERRPGYQNLLAKEEVNEEITQEPEVYEPETYEEKEKSVEENPLKGEVINSKPEKTESKPVLDKKASPDGSKTLIKEELTIENTENETVVQDELKPIVEEDLETKNKTTGMTPGNYVVVGVFQYEDNAISYMKNVGITGHQAKMAFNEEKSYYYVFLDNMDDIEKARQMRNDMRKSEIPLFSDTWVLVVK